MPIKNKESRASRKKTASGTKRRNGAADNLRTVKNEKDDFYIVGMGASAGGLEALEAFFKQVPADSGMAFVLVPHLDPTHASIMPELLQKHCRIKVHEVKDGTKARPNELHIVPANKNLAILHGVLQLLETSEDSTSRLPIDYFLRSLAQDMRERAVAVILSGMGSDGTLGVRAVKAELGMAMVQEPRSARYDSMPKSAVATGLVDYVLPPEKMPEQLIAYARHAGKAEHPWVPEEEGKLSDAMQKIFILLRSHTGHDFSSYKRSTITRRLERRMNVHQIDTLPAYVRYLQHNSQEIGTLFKELLIGVTSFFRDPHAFEALKHKVIRQLVRDKPYDGSLRAWVPGCSTGEEAYSLAMLIQEGLEEAERSMNVQIFATDLDADAVEAARSGIYPASISTDVSPERLKRFFLQEEATFRIKKNIREMLVFAPQDLIRDPPFTKLDLLCCRNLLIYLDAELQKKLLPLFHFSLRPGGALFLGTSETIGSFLDLFATVDKKWKIFRRRETAGVKYGTAEFGFRSQPEPHPEVKVGKSKQMSTAQMAVHALLDTYAPASVLINEKGDILYVHGRTGAYLEPAPGEANWNLLEMAREGLRAYVPMALRKALSLKREVTQTGLQVKDNSGFRTISLTVRLLTEMETEPSLLLVVFEEKPPAEQRQPQRAKARSGKKPDARTAAIEQELQQTRESLQITIEELETSNEELKSANEELQSTNEELQSANEELETSKEEQQSLNEELVTVNSELQQKIEELTAAYAEMRRLLESIEVPTIFLDNNLNIKRFTAQITRVINVIETDTGRPLRHIASNLKYENLAEDAREVLRTLAFREREIQTLEGRWYLMRIVPYRRGDNVIDGVVITFLDIHEQKTAVEKIRELNRKFESACRYAENIIDTLREPFVVLNESLKVVSANHSFYEFFKVSARQTGGRHIYDLGDRQWDIPRLRQLLEQIIPQNHSLDDFAVEHDFQSIGRRKLLLNARRISRADQGEDLILLAFEDVTEK